MSGAEGPLRIAVAGGSIGGLCAGIALRGAGFDVQVYERIARPDGDAWRRHRRAGRTDRSIADLRRGRFADDALHGAPVSQSRRR